MRYNCNSGPPMKTPASKLFKNPGIPTAGKRRRTGGGWVASGRVGGWRPGASGRRADSGGRIVDRLPEYQEIYIYIYIYISDLKYKGLCGNLSTSFFLFGGYALLWPGTAPPGATPFADMLLDKVGQGRNWAVEAQESAVAACLEGNMSELTYLVAKTGNFGKWRSNVRIIIYNTHTRSMLL